MTGHFRSALHGGVNILCDYFQ